MKKLLFSLSLILIYFVGQGSPATLAQGKPTAAGHWEGAINVQGMEIAILVDLAQDEKGQWSGEIDVPSQGAKDLALTAIVVDGANVSFMMPNVPGDPTFKGKLSEDGQAITGDFLQHDQTFAFKLARKAASSQGASTQAPPATSGIEGEWQGVLSLGQEKLKLVFKISKNPDGTLTGSLDSPDQSAMNMPLSAVSLKENGVRFELSLVEGIYEGTLDKGKSEISGQWKQRGTVFPLTLKRGEKTGPPARPQEPKKPYPYDEEEVIYENTRAAVKLAGTLTLPRAKGPFPAVLLITGSGPQDRNESLLGHKPFLVLADHLTRLGVAVLRVDDRGVGKSTGSFATATSEDFADDALAGVEYLRSRKEIDPKRIGLVGHSEGGMIAPMVAARSADVAFIVLMAGTGLTGEEIGLRQSALISKANGVSDESIARNRALLESMFTAVKQEKESAAAEKKVRESVARWKASLTEEQKAAASATEAAMEAQVKMILTPWFRYFLTYDPKPALAKVKCPVLAISGEKDLQVPPKENLEAIRKALESGGNKEYKIVSLPNLNHLFQTSNTGSPSEYMKIEETLSPVALDVISDWILKQAVKQ